MNDYSTYNDLELLPLLREPKPACDNAFFVLYQRYSTKINDYCAFKIGRKDLAEEIFQETWIRFDKAAKDSKNIFNVPAYLLTIARNLCIDHVKEEQKNHKMLVNIDDISLDRVGNPFDFHNNIGDNELISIIKVSVNNLEDIYKEAFVLKKFEELTYKEVAGLCGVSLVCIKQRIKRATAMLKESLKPYIKELSN